jgi:hypothetical protein
MTDTTFLPIGREVEVILDASADAKDIPRSYHGRVGLVAGVRRTANGDTTYTLDFGGDMLFGLEGEYVRPTPKKGMPVSYELNGDTWCGSIKSVLRAGRSVIVAFAHCEEKFTRRADGTYRPQGCEEGILDLGVG